MNSAEAEFQRVLADAKVKLVIHGTVSQRLNPVKTQSGVSSPHAPEHRLLRCARQKLQSQKSDRNQIKFHSAFHGPRKQHWAELPKPKKVRRSYTQVQRSGRHPESGGQGPDQPSSWRKETHSS